MRGFSPSSPPSLLVGVCLFPAKCSRFYDVMDPPPLSVLTHFPTGDRTQASSFFFFFFFFLSCRPQRPGFFPGDKSMRCCCFPLPLLSSPSHRSALRSPPLPISSLFSSSRDLTENVVFLPVIPGRDFFFFFPFFLPNFEHLFEIGYEIGEKTLNLPFFLSFPRL